MFDFLKTGKAKKEEELYMDFVSRVGLNSLQEGNVNYLYYLQYVFFLAKEKHYHIEVARAYVSLLQNTPISKLIDMDERSHQCVYETYIIHGNMDWKSKTLARKQLQYLSDEQYAAVLCFGTFHSNGYYRQMCIIQLAEYENSLPFLLLRLNDWVDVVRESACQSAMYRIQNCGINELFTSMVVLEKIRKSGRREKEKLILLENKMQSQIQQKFSEYELSKIHKLDHAVKNAVYRFIVENKILELENMEKLLVAEKDGYGKRLLILAILKQYECSEEKLYQYLTNKSSIIRYHAMEHYYAQKKDAWNGLEELLLDKTRKVRENAGYILKKHKNFDVLTFYKERLQEPINKIVLLGIGENGSGNDIKDIQSYLEHENEHVAKAALQAYGMLQQEKGEELYWTFLMHPNILLYTEAYRTIKKYHICFGAKKLYTAYEQNRNLPVSEYFIQLLFKEPSWKRLPYLLMLYREETLSENLRKGIQNAVNFRYMYGKVSKDEAEWICKILEERKTCIPEKVAEGILWDLKFVVC